MDIKNIEKLPPGAGKVLGPYLDELEKLYNGAMISIFAYGSVTGPDYDPRTSDINIAVVLKDTSVKELRSALKIVKSGIRKRITVPLFLTSAYIKMSLDTFPMEFMNMKDTRLVLFGDDVLADISANNEDLRRECEYQLKGKLLTIRQAYLEQALGRRGLERLIKMSLRALLPVFQNMLRIKRGNPPPRGRTEVLMEVGEAFNIDMSAFLEVAHDRKTEGRIAGKPAESFIDTFLARLEHLSGIVDNI
ncbi:MAG: hypothetical protein KAS86_02890 [Candidatus Omnitrophica bacterium]|nr:hypothetical protein [Candidatus Omnitrophota bacterium]